MAVIKVQKAIDRMENKQLEKLDRDGYLLVDDSELGLDLADLSNTLAKFLANAEFENLSIPAPTANLLEYVSAIHDGASSSHLTGRLYQILPTIPFLLSKVTNEKLISFLRSISVRAPTIGTFPICRIDRPNDATFQTPWHQDHWFSFTSPNSVTLWAPLGPVTDDHGRLRVMPRSHKAGVYEFREYMGGHEPFEPVDPINEDDAVEVSVPFRKVLIFRQGLLHKSGWNKSTQCRVTLQVRYNDMHGLPHPFSTVGFASSQHVLDNQQRWLRK